MTYEPKKYWQDRLKTNFDITGVGCLGFNETYNKYLYSLKLSSLEIVLDEHTVIEGKFVLDIGCGTGFFVDYYSRKGAKKITGVDITKVSILKLTEKYPQYNFLVADISSPNISLKERFDIVNAFDVIYHIVDDAKFKTALHNISAWCAKGGYVLITDYFCKKDIITATHVHHRSLRTYENELSKGSIRIVDIIPMYYLMNRHFHLPIIILNKICPLFYLIDRSLQRMKTSNGRNMKLMIGAKSKE
ncbi:MAG: class I SAM-dependent methyltransferase [Candidatus Bathyarchaeota archaeon]|nr:class I SAM-dependent methyltransferase [Candidatus Bathyarchaeota archaeon]